MELVAGRSCWSLVDRNEQDRQLMGRVGAGGPSAWLICRSRPDPVNPVHSCLAVALPLTSIRHRTKGCNDEVAAADPAAATSFVAW